MHADSLSLAAAVELNEVEFLLALGRAGGGEERHDEEITWTIGGSPIAYHNCVVRAGLDDERADAAIAASIGRMRAHGVPGSWHVGPSMRPEDLARRLESHGFEGGPEPGMAARIGSLADVAVPEGLSTSRVRDEAALEAFAGVLAVGFGEGEREARWVQEMYRRIGLNDSVPWRHFLGRVDGEPVATTTLFFTGDVAGVYFVCTRPDVRRRGIGAAITRAALDDAAAGGSRLAVLGSSPMGRRVYERLGFRHVCDVGVYEWTP